MKLFSLIALLSLALQSSKADAQIVGEKIGYVKGQDFIFAADTVKLKQSLEKIINMERVKLDKIEIKKDITIGDRKEDYYMLIAYDYSKDLKIARWLVNREGALFYYNADLEGDITDNDIFYSTYFTCYGTNTDCFPMVAHLPDGYSWGGSTDFTCKTDSACTGIKTVIIED